MTLPDPKNDDLEDFQEKMHAAIKVASPTEISEAVADAAQFIEDLFDKVPSHIFGYNNETHTHINNATAIMCRGVNELVDRRA
jgi:hypothetical protein